jgi:hypothetical protein
MNLFILMLLIPLSFAGSPPNCGELGKILEGYETRLQRDGIKDCKPDLYKAILQDRKVVDPEFLKGKVCQDLTTIESQVSQLRLELAVMNGIHKLVETVKDAKEKSSSKKEDVAAANARTFVVSLNTAQSLEVLLQSATAEGKLMMSGLKEFDKTKLMSKDDLIDRVKELCKNNPKNAEDACNPALFNPSKEAAEELISMVRNSNPDQKQIAAWQGQLAIKRKNAKPNDKGYTFTAMQNELGGAFSNLDSKDVMTKNQLASIQKLDDFEMNSSFNFVQDISKIKDQKKVKAASDKFFLLMGDAKRRQQFEVQSKLSLVWEDVKNHVPNLTGAEQARCSNGKNSYDDAAFCIASLKKAAPNVTEPLARPKLNDVLPALETSVNYINKLGQKETSCREEIKSKDEITTACFAEFNRDRAKLQDQILQLNIVKDKIGAQNVTNMAFRNLALQKWSAQKCNFATSTMDMCEDESALPKDLHLALGDAMKIAVVFTQSEKERTEAEKKAEAICDDDERKQTAVEERMCQFFNDTTSNIVQTTGPTKNKDDVDGPMAPKDAGKNDNDKIRDAWIQGGANILGSLLPAYLQNPNSAVSPYPYNYSPTGITGPMGISDTILTNARYYGAYGYYMPTPGYQPYTAFGLNSAAASSYKPVSTIPSRYFSF